MVASGLRRRAEAALEDLGLGRDVTDERLRTALEERRGKPIVVVPAPADVFADTACGAWWEAAHVDVVLVPEDADPMLRAHTVRHELAHMVLRHQGSANGSAAMADLLRRVLPDLDPDKVLGMLTRSEFSGPAEREAEMLATVLTLRADDATSTLAVAEAEALRRMLTGTDAT